MPISPTTVVELSGDERDANERRSTRRLRTRLRDASLAERRGRTLVECRIRDRSEHGARLLLDQDRVLPRTFLLTDAAVDTSFRATLVWQTGREAGVRLLPLA